jgi:hypothetical protein
MPKAGGKRNRKKAEDALSRKATQHHDFVGEAEADRAQSRAVEEMRIEHDHRELEKEVVHEMATELEQMAGVAQPAAEPADAARREASVSETAETRPPSPSQGAVRDTIDLIRRTAPEAFDAMRAKAEERLEAMPGPVKTAIHLTERAFGLALWPVRTGVHLMGRVLETPVALLRILLTRRTA